MKHNTMKQNTMKQNESTLDTQVFKAIEKTKTFILKQVRRNDCESQEDVTAELFDNLDDIVYKCMPTDRRQIRNIWQTCKPELEKAHRNGHPGMINPFDEEGDVIQASIYSYMYGKVIEWYDENIENLFLQENKWHVKRMSF